MGPVSGFLRHRASHRIYLHWHYAIEAIERAYDDFQAGITEKTGLMIHEVIQEVREQYTNISDEASLLGYYLG